MRHLTLVLLCALLVVVCVPVGALDLKSPAAVLMDARSGRILYAHNAEEPRAIASLTKIMTLVLVLEDVAAGVVNLDELVVASPYASSMTGTRIWLEPYEKMTVKELIYSVAVGSANDGAVALAEHLAGSEAEFAQRMNQRALELGLTNTSFANVTGLPAEYTAQEATNYSTALDLAKLCRHALSVPGLLEALSTYHYSVREGRKPQIELYNLNKLLERTVGGKTYGYSGVDGFKTGTTTKAGYCIAVTALRDNLRLIAVVLGAESEDQRLQEASSLLDYGFRNFQAQLVTAKGDFRLPVSVPLSATDQVDAVLGADFYVTLPKGDTGQVEMEVVIHEDLVAPLDQGQVIGYLVCKRDGEELARAELLASDPVERGNILHITYYTLRNMLTNLFQ